jgi:transposase InsO family protein
MGIEALYRRPRTTNPEPGHKIYPYLLRSIEITRPNQVWAMDITYIPMERGFVYLAVVLDWATRRVLSWRLSVTMEAAFCVETLEDALARHGRPDIFNTDQGSHPLGRPAVDLGQRQRSFGAHLMFRRTGAQLTSAVSSTNTKREVRHECEEASFDQISDSYRDCCQRPIGACRSYSKSSASQGGRVLPVRQLSRRLRCPGRSRAQASAGGTRCGTS